MNNEVTLFGTVCKIDYNEKIHLPYHLQKSQNIRVNQRFEVAYNGKYIKLQKTYKTENTARLKDLETLKVPQLENMNFFINNKVEVLGIGDTILINTTLKGFEVDITKLS